MDPFLGGKGINWTAAVFPILTFIGILLHMDHFMGNNVTTFIVGALFHFKVITKHGFSFAYFPTLLCVAHTAFLANTLGQKVINFCTLKSEYFIATVCLAFFTFLHSPLICRCLFWYFNFYYLQWHQICLLVMLILLHIDCFGGVGEGRKEIRNVRCLITEYTYHCKIIVWKNMVIRIREISKNICTDLPRCK